MLIVILLMRNNYFKIINNKELLIYILIYIEECYHMYQQIHKKDIKFIIWIVLKNQNLQLLKIYLIGYYKDTI